MKKGFGFLGIIIFAAVILSVAFGGGMYLNESKKQQSLLQTGEDAVKRAEEVKKQIESREESIYGGSTSINSDGDTSDWKTYRNEKYGFEVKYPADLKVRVSENSVLGTVKNPVIGVYVGDILFVALDAFLLEKARIEYLNRYIGVAENPEKGIGEEGITIHCQIEYITGVQSKTEAVYCTGEGGPAFYALIGDRIFVQFIGRSQSVIEIKAILSTFKFTN